MVFLRPRTKKKGLGDGCLPGPGRMGTGMFGKLTGRLPCAAAVDVVALVDEDAHQPCLQVALLSQGPPTLPRLLQAALHRIFAVAFLGQDGIAHAIQGIGERDDLLRKPFVRHAVPPSF